MITRARVKFEKVKKDYFLKNKYTAFDMHFHTSYSDGKVKIPELVKKIERLNIGVAITDHNEIKGTIEISKYENIKSIPGIEITSNEGVHLLAYFYEISELCDYYNHNVLPYKRRMGLFLKRNITEVIEDLKKYECIVVAAHPYALSWTGICKPIHSKKIDVQTIRSLNALEVLNGENTRSANLKALDLAETLQMPITGGSDGHTIIELGQVVTYIKKEVSAKEFLDYVKKDETLIRGKENKKISMVLNQTRQRKTISITHIKRHFDYLKFKIKE